MNRTKKLIAALMSAALLTGAVALMLLLDFGSHKAIADGDCGENVQKVTQQGNVEVWKISCPNIRQGQTTYDQIKLRPGDTVVASAEGCAQTGGAGKTWKRYVDPQGPNSDRLYHGLIKMPGMPGLTRIQDFLQNAGSYKVPDDASGPLILGYEDDDYGDNGYWGHDDGTGDQCKNVGNVSVQLIIVRK